MTPKNITLFLLSAILLTLGIAFFTVNVIVIQPIGAIPKGKTIIITKLNNVRFIDSADAICQRNVGGVSLLCRGAVLGKIAEESNIIFRLPYNKYLYLLTTGGVSYDN